MQASTVLLPAPEAPNKPTEFPCPSSSEKSTVISRRFLTIRVLSMTLTLCQDVNQPGKRESDGKEHHQQRHNCRQAKALQIHPKLHRHSRGIVSRDHHGAELTNGPHPRNTERDGESQFGKRQGYTQKNSYRREPEQRCLFLQHGWNRIQGGHSSQNVIAHANINLRGDKCGGAVGHHDAVALQCRADSAVRTKCQRHEDAKYQWRQKYRNK